MKAGEAARRSMLRHLGNRGVLAMDDMVELTDIRPRLEKEMSIPGIKGKIYFFSIDGTLRGTRFSGMLFAGECIMVQEERGDFRRALNIAKEGVNETMRLAKEMYEAQNRLVVVADKPLDHVQVGVGGRRSAASFDGLSTDEKLKRMLAHRLGGKPWLG